MKATQRKRVEHNVVPCANKRNQFRTQTQAVISMQPNTVIARAFPPV